MEFLPVQHALANPGVHVQKAVQVASGEDLPCHLQQRQKLLICQHQRVAVGDKNGLAQGRGLAQQVFHGIQVGSKRNGRRHGEGPVTVKRAERAFIPTASPRGLHHHREILIRREDAHRGVGGGEAVTLGQQLFRCPLQHFFYQGRPDVPCRVPHLFQHSPENEGHFPGRNVPAQAHLSLPAAGQQARVQGAFVRRAPVIPAPVIPGEQAALPVKAQHLLAAQVAERERIGLLL